MDDNQHSAQDIKDQLDQEIVGGPVMNPSEIEQLKRDYEQALERNRYLVADFDTFRRRAHEDCRRLVEAAQMDIVRELLPLADDFDRAVVQMEQKPELKPYVMGLELTYKSLLKLLSNLHVSDITEVTAFDPELHEAILQVDDPDKASGHIVEVLQKGYRYKNQVIRPSRVSVKP